MVQRNKEIDFLEAREAETAIYWTLDSSYCEYESANKCLQSS
jgi:hypothetical protein